MYCVLCCVSPPLPTPQKNYARFLAVGSYDCTIRILSLEDGNQMRAVATQSTHTVAGAVS